VRGNRTNHLAVLGERSRKLRILKKQKTSGRYQFLENSNLLYHYTTMARLPTRKLGKNGPEVSAIGFGAMGLSYSYGRTDAEEERFKVLDRALALGATFWDSSDVCWYFVPQLISRT